MSIAQAIFGLVFRAVGFDRIIAKQVLSDPDIQSEVEKMQKSMSQMDQIIKDREALQRKRGQIK